MAWWLLMSDDGLANSGLDAADLCSFPWVTGE